MSRPKVFVLYSPGTNCHEEAADAFKLAGGDPAVCNITDDLLGGKKRLTDCDILALPGGFSFGDHLAAGRIATLDLIYRLKDQLEEVKDKEIPIIGICNGFQILVNTGLLPADAVADPTAILDRNTSAVFEDRWTDCVVQKSNCLWTKGLEGKTLRIPVAHGEGRLRVTDNFDDAQTVVRYGSDEGTMDYPDNPNGSKVGRAGICDPSGRIFGLMPHPERAIYPWLGSDDGLAVFQAGVAAVA